MSDLTLYQITDDLRSLIYKLNDDEAFDEEGELIPELNEALQLTSRELQDKAVSYGYVIKHYQDQEAIIKAEIDRLKNLQAGVKKRTETVTDRIKTAMQEFGIDKIEGGTLTLKLSKSKSVNVYDQDKLEERFLRTKTVVEPDKVAIKEAILKDGELIEGAEIKENTNLRIS